MSKNIHPGKILLEEFLKPMELSGHALAKAIRVNKSHIYQIIRGECNITAKMALKLSGYFGNSWQFWMGLQNEYEIERELGNRD